jgi:mRNA-degrading endonuclease YafQ of YafQ-DinJ toxin-antitoxin module
LDTEVGKQISSSRAAAGKHKMHNNKPELKIISNLRSWIGLEPIQQDHAITGHWWELHASNATKP